MLQFSQSKRFTQAIDRAILSRYMMYFKIHNVKIWCKIMHIKRYLCKRSRSHRGKSRHVASSKWKRNQKAANRQWSHHIIIDVELATYIVRPTKRITLQSKSRLYANERLLSHGMAYNASDTSLRSLHTALVASPLTRFRVPDRRE